ncbi:hypothetical protein Q3G72_004058 [Acer saccharum]|nr:hypothetical protein Q3G72_004058 [Acer saccharum]
MKSPTANLKSLPNMERHEIVVDPPTLPNHSEYEKGISQIKVKLHGAQGLKSDQVGAGQSEGEPCFEESESIDFSSDFLQENGTFFKPKNLQGERSKISNQHNSGSHSLPEIQLVVQLYGSKGDSENCGEALERSSGPGCSTSQNLWPN